MKRKLMAVILAMVLVLTQGMAAHAAEIRSTDVIPTLAFDGTTAECQVRITAPGKKIVATLELWCGTVLIDSWPGTASTLLVINGSGTVVKGRTYTLKVSGTIGGETFQGTPISATCN